MCIISRRSLKETNKTAICCDYPNDYIQSISLAPGNANQCENAKKKKNSNENQVTSACPGTYQIIIQTGQNLIS